MQPAAPALEDEMLTTGLLGSPRGSVNRQELFPFLLIVAASQVGAACPLGGRCSNTVWDIVGPMPGLGGHPPSPATPYTGPVCGKSSSGLTFSTLPHTNAQCHVHFAPRTLPWVSDLNYSSHLAPFWGVHSPVGNSHSLAVAVGGSAG